MSKIFETNFHRGSMTETFGNTLTNGGVEFKETGIGTCAYFDGSSYIDLATPLSLGTKHSFSIIKKFENNGAFMAGDLSPQYYIGFETSAAGGRLYYSVNTVITYSNINNSKGKFVFLVIVRDGVNVTRYENGQLQSTGILSSNDPLTVDTIGAFNTHTNNYGGYMGDLKAFDDVLSQTEINELYQEFLQRKQLAVQTDKFYYPKPTEDTSDGIVASYNMVTQDGKVVDISGNGNDLDVNYTLETIDGLSFDGVKSNCNTTTTPTIDSKTISISVHMIYDSDNVILENSINYNNNPQSFLFWINSNKLTVALNLATSGVSYVSYSCADSLTIGQLYFFVVVVDTDLVGSSIIRLFINGEEQTTIKVTDGGTRGVPIKGYPFYIASRGGTSLFLKTRSIQSLKVYRKKLTDTEIKDKYNSLARQISLYEDFRYALADGTNQTPINWIKGTGSFKVVEDAGLDGNSKAIECTSSGDINIQSTQAYGTREFDIERSSANIMFIEFISSLPAYSSSSSGYRLYIYADNHISFLRTNPGSTLWYTNAGYLSTGTSYRIKITRGTDGEFTVYIKGGAYGNTYTLISTDGDQNPRTDNVHTTSKYMNLYAESGGQFSNIKLSKGIV